MIKKIREYLQRRKDAAAVDRFDNGFAWAVTEYFLGRRCLANIASYPETARQFGSYDEFDSGIDAALVLLCDLGFDDEYNPFCPDAQSTRTDRVH